MANAAPRIEEEDRGPTRSSSLWKRLAIWLALLAALWAWQRWMEPPPPQAPGNLSEVQGVRLLYRYECGKCHRVSLPGMDGTMGPPLEGLSRHSREYLEESLRVPGKVVVRGYINGMPSYDHLPKHEMEELLDYLLTL